jgi:alginate export protein
VAVSLTAAAYWRQSTADGIYAISGNLVRSGKGSDARFIGNQVELSVAWQATAELNLSASISAFEPGRFIAETGPARAITLVGVMANFRF